MKLQLNSVLSVNGTYQVATGRGSKDEVPRTISRTKRSSWLTSCSYSIPRKIIIHPWWYLVLRNFTFAFFITAACTYVQKKVQLGWVP
jgi:hypothetical protein